MRRSNAITLKDVAREAGVAKMTASVVLNGARSGTHVSDTTRQRILDAATRLGYRPNAVARGLSRRRMDLLGVVAVSDAGGLQGYFLEVFNGIVMEAARHGQAAAVFPIPGWDDVDILRPRLMGLCDSRVDGLIFLGSHDLDHALADAVRQHTPLVTIHAADAPAWLHNVDVDNERGAYAATRHLIDLGHRRIAHLPGRVESPRLQAGALERFTGYRRALEEAGIPFDPALVPTGDYGEASGRERTEHLLGELSDSPLPTAYCCANDAIALGCLAALRDYGLQVPKEVSVTGFDDLPVARTITPPLTTVRQPFFQLGRRAVERLMAQIDPKPLTAGPPGEESAAAAGTETLPVELLIRGTTAAPPPQKKALPLAH